MDTIPGFVETLPPPPPPRPSHKGLWIGLAIGAVVLCLCCILVIGVYTFRQDIPFISNFFPSPTPSGLFYTNPAARISLYYPPTWQYDESGDASSVYDIFFASSTDNLNNSDFIPQTGAILNIMIGSLTTSDLPFTIDASSLGSLVEFLSLDFFSGTSQSQNIHTFTLSGYPAASGVFTGTVDTGNPSTVYLIAVLRETGIIIFLGVCPESEWAQHQPTFDSILDSVTLVTP